MLLPPLLLLLLLPAVLASTCCTSTPAVTKDVLIIGGGATGTYAAINLTDSAHSVAVVEATGRLGGHASTYTSPQGYPADYGVIVLSNEPVVHAFLARFNLSWELVNPNNPSIDFFDFATGAPSSAYTIPDNQASLRAYRAVVARYPFLANGFTLPDPVPEELLRPFGDLIAKYHLADMTRLFFQWGQGFGDVLKLPALYAMKYFSETWVAGINGTQFIVTTTGSMQNIYDRAANVLGDNVYYNSTVAAVDRTAVDAEGYIRTCVSTPAGPRIIRSKKLLVTIPPLMSPKYILPLRPSAREAALFSQFSHFNLWAAVVTDLSIAADQNLQNVAPGVNATPYGLAQMPAVYYFRQTPAPGVWATSYGTLHAEELSDAQVKADILATLGRLRENGGYSNATGLAPAQVVAFRDHSPYELHVSPDAVRRGFYTHLYALQGHRNTFWTGAAWDAHDSSGLWRFTGKVLEQLKEEL